jgi:hypothetical protein
MPDGQLLLLGEYDQEIAAMSLIADQADASVVKIQAIAIASRYRGMGGPHSAEVMEVTLEAAAERARKQGHNTVVVVGWVDPRNTPSKRMNQRAGLSLRRITPGGLEEWVAAIDLAD